MYTLILIFLLQLAIFQPSTALKCPLGHIEKNGACEPCPPGTYRDGDFGTKCEPCHPGFFNPHPAAPDPEVCRQCLQDTFNPDAGATECKACPAGTMADRGSEKCVKCRPGTRVSGSGKGECEKCEPGYYSSGASNRYCERCPNGLTSPKGADSVNKCKKCPPGRSGDDCIPCIRGFFQNEAGACERCPAGSVSRPGSVKCRKCKAGTFEVFGERNRGHAYICKPCAKGTTSGKGSTKCRKPGEQCPKNTFENSDGGCLGCGEGYIMNEKSKECDKCPAGSTSRGGVQKNCVVCKGELVPDSQNALCRCKRGFYYEKGKCFPCPAGTGGNFANTELRGRDGCIKCSFGEFAAKPGSEVCTPCPFGTVATKQGATSCTPCPKGTVPNFDLFEEANSCVRVETGCPLGFKYKHFWGSFCKRIKN